MAIDPIKVELCNSQFLGDLVTMSCAIRDMAAVRRCTLCHFEAVIPKKALLEEMECPNCGRQSLLRKYRVKVRVYDEETDRWKQQIFDNNPYLEDFIEPDISLNIGTRIACKQSKTSGKHICEAYRNCIMLKSGITFPQGELITDLHLSEHEKTMPPLIAGRYWVICIGKRHPFTSKYWPPEHWQTVVSALPHITFVQVGHSDHKHVVLQGPNMINMIGQTQDMNTGVRDLIRLVYNSDGCLTLISSLMHIAATFKKPAVVVAGAREPARFEEYPFQRFLHNEGTMKCIGNDGTRNKEFPDGRHRAHSGMVACWKASAEACQNRVGEYPKCITMIQPEQVINAVESYYEGGQLEPISALATKLKTRKPVFKMVCNTHGFGGGERSAIWLMNRMLLEGYDVQLLSTVPTENIGTQFRKALSRYVQFTDDLTGTCDILMVYANDMVYGFKDKYALLEKAQAERKLMVLNYRLGDAGKLDWTKAWDRYIFLCSEMRDVFLTYVPEAETVVLPPPVDLKLFLDRDIGTLNKTLHIVRVGSQSSAKFPSNIKSIIQQIQERRPGTKFTFMGGHPAIVDLPKVTCHDEYSQPVIEILRQGTVFWYILPDGYLDNGPRVIMEAMAVGLPVIADNRGGAKDRITEECGWLCNSVDEHLDVISGLDGSTLSTKGRASKERARTEFDPEKWIDTING